ncbi:hypothetical protein Ahy_B08g091945 isoform I [Arachis hypogaea]|uniref:Uncharacterized protein n=1 Tax=Arachis hypogaea TaxID=3818 RepID=A0A444Y2T8_ARAHY|nr:hypothetical protein Ahy_B08g091945 isoform I [Arachis hypogaea]
MDTTTTSNWRDQLQPETRQIILNNIANPSFIIDTNPRQHGSRNRRMPAWTDDYHMG